MPPEQRLSPKRALKRADPAARTGLGDAEVRGLNVAMELGSNETHTQALMAGLGLAPISAHTIAVGISYGRLVALDVEGLSMMRQWFIVRRRARAKIRWGLSLSIRSQTSLGVHRREAGRKSPG